jgi:hypothetical protein
MGITQLQKCAGQQYNATFVKLVDADMQITILSIRIVHVLTREPDVLDRKHTAQRLSYQLDCVHDL